MLAVRADGMAQGRNAKTSILTAGHGANVPGQLKQN